MGQNVVQGSALMGDFQTQADLVGIFAEDLLVRHNDETGGVAVGIVDPFFQNLQSVGLARIFAGDGIDSFDLFHLRAGQCQQAVFDGDHLLSHDVVFEFHQQIVDFIDNARRGIFNGKYGKIRTAFINGTHGIPEGFHMECIDILAKKFPHGCLGIGTFRTLIDHSGTLGLQFIHTDEGESAFTAMGCQQLVLELSAHGHDLFKQFLHAVAVEIIMGQCLDSGDLLLLSLFVKYFFAGLYFIFRHLSADIHALLIEIHDLPVNGVDLLSQL